MTDKLQNFVSMQDSNCNLELNTILYFVEMVFIFTILCLIVKKLFFKENEDESIYTNENFTNCHETDSHSHPKEESNLCRGFLTDKEYLEHMIPHHQVAVDISILLQDKTKSPVMRELLRKLIWTQNTEITIMNMALDNLPISISSEDEMYRSYRPNLSDFIKPNTLGLTDTFCDPHFFDPEGHMKHINSPDFVLDDKSYIEHMIPHHQVAVDMSKVLLKNTKNDFMIYLAYRIIRSQQEEIIMLNDFLEKSLYKHEMLM